MKKFLLLLLILAVLSVGILYVAISHMELLDGPGMVYNEPLSEPEVLEEPLDGDYTYVDNELLMERLVGTWATEEQDLQLSVNEDYTLCLTSGENTLLEATMDFTFLQPGPFQDVDIRLEPQTLEDGGTVEEFFTRMNFEDSAKSRLCMMLRKGETETSITLVKTG